MSNFDSDDDANAASDRIGFMEQYPNTPQEDLERMFPFKKKKAAAAGSAAGSGAGSGAASKRKNHRTVPPVPPATSMFVINLESQKSRVI
jgi:hypothetical protein